MLAHLIRRLVASARSKRQNKVETKTRQKTTFGTGFFSVQFMIFVLQSC